MSDNPKPDMLERFQFDLPSAVAEPKVLAPHKGSMALWLIGLPRSLKRVLQVLLDIGLCFLAVWLAFYLRLGTWPDENFDPWTPSIAAVLLGIPIFIRSGFYRAILRYTGLATFVSFAIAIAVFLLPYSALFTFYGLDGVPRTIGLLVPLVLFILVGGSRGMVRLWLGDHYISMVKRNELPAVLIYGAGNAGRQLARALTTASEFNVKGFLDDDVGLTGATVNDLPIYPSDQAEAIIEQLNIKDVLLAIPSASRSRRMEVAAQIKRLGVDVLALPSVTDIARGKVSINDLHEVQIEDLLGRVPIPGDPDLLQKNIVGKTVLVTGAGGSIGQELSRQIAKLGAERLLLLDVSEFALYAISNELSAMTGPSCEIVPLIGSVWDEGMMRTMMKRWKPHTVFHAAAYKHVPLVEANLVEGARNNIMGTAVTARAALESGVGNFILVSTDKAVRPTNSMGATKRFAEMVLQRLDAQSPECCFSMVRFGNVLGSSGSVVPLFRQQIANGGPVTITDKRMTRYFMTIPEAAQLVIQSGAMARGGEVFLLDMGQPVKIMDLARNMILLSGLSVKGEGSNHGDIEIREVGLRPGEKLYEELLIGDDAYQTGHPRIFQARETSTSFDADVALARLSEAIETRDSASVRALLQDVVSEFEPTAALMDYGANAPAD